MSVLSVFNPPSASQSLYSSWVTITQQHISPGVKVCYVIFTVISASMQALMEWLSRCFSAALVKSFFQLFNFIKFFFHLSLSLSLCHLLSHPLSNLTLSPLHLCVFLSRAWAYGRIDRRCSASCLLSPHTHTEMNVNQCDVRWRKCIKT